MSVKTQFGADLIVSDFLNFLVKEAKATSSSVIGEFLSEPEMFIEQLRGVLIGKNIVIKYGGSVVDKSSVDMLSEILLLRYLGASVTIVHGGGKDINHLLDRLNLESRFVNGIRVTDQEVLDVATMVLAGKVNKMIVSTLNRLGGYACGLSGVDFGFIRSYVADPAFGYVGNIRTVDTTPLDHLFLLGAIPVVSTLGLGDDFEILNINADIVAGGIASSFASDYLFFISDVDGVLDKNGSLISVMNVEEDLKKSIDDKSIHGGMIPKTTSCLQAKQNGVKFVKVINGRRKFSLLLSILSEELAYDLGIRFGIEIDKNMLGTTII